MNYLLDTNVISELVAKHPHPRVVQWVDDQDPNSLYLSVITIGELRKGIEKLADSARKQRLHEWLHDDLLLRFNNRILLLRVDEMLTWGALAGRLERGGRPLPAIDSLLAALALHHGHILATRNESDFKETGLVIVNPWKY